MPKTQKCDVNDLCLDLRNFRTMPQSNEINAIKAIISANPDWFWALAESLLDDGYHPTENILLLRDQKATKAKRGSKSDVDETLTVKEGNRRIGALKLILGIIDRAEIGGVPNNIEQKIVALSEEWRSANLKVPCVIYEAKEASVVDRIVTLTHGKGEKAGRDKWEAIARARHNRDMKGESEPALDLLEAFLKHGKVVTELQKERWGGDYPLSVLDEAIKKIAPRLGAASARDLVSQYPKTISHRDKVEQLLLDIGNKSLGFNDIRKTGEDFALTKYQIPAIQSPSPSGAASPKGKKASSASASASSTTPAATATPVAKSGKQNATPIDDPRTVKRHLRAFTPKGSNREKIATLRDEAKLLNLDTHPIAFCFLLRSMFELSAKAYCGDHAASGLSVTKPNGEDKHLINILGEIVSHLTVNNTDKAAVKSLHGAATELGKSVGILSITSMNQLVHNPKFSIKAADICNLFGNVFPLLEAMNR